MEALQGLSELRSALRGNVLLPTEDGGAFHRALQVWAVSPHHSTPPPTPAVVVQPRGTADVAATIKWAASCGLDLAVKGGGHGAGNPSWAGSVLLDLSLMRSVYVDPDARTAVVDGGCLALDVDAETSLHGLATPLGVCSVVGVGGLALNGGVSLLSRAHGSTCMNILEATVVLADGAVVHVTQESDPELFWALRGAGSALGAVTKLKLRLYDVSAAFCGTLVWEDDPAHRNFRTILRWLRDVALPEPSIGFNVARAVDPEMGPVLVSMVVLLGDEPPEARQAKLKVLRDLGPVQDTVGTSSWAATQRTHEPAFAALARAVPRHYEAWSGGMVSAESMSDAFIEAVVRVVADEVPPECRALTSSFIELLGGALKDSAAPTGFADRDLQWVVQAGWTDASSNDTGLRHTAAVRAALGPVSDAMGSYVNMVDGAEVTELSYPEAAAKVGGAANLERLRAVKARVDPANFFCHSPFAAVLGAAAAES